MKYIPFLAALVLMPALGAAADGDVNFVQSSKAKLMAEPSFKGEVVAELAKGDKVTLLEERKRWLRVETASRQNGWISSFLLSATPPIEKVNLLDSADSQALEESARRRASAVTTAGAARGLAADDRARASADEKADYRALQKVEAYRIDQEEVSAFAQEGELP